jgi:hypothetical protein
MNAGRRRKRTPRKTKKKRSQRAKPASQKAQTGPSDWPGSDEETQKVITMLKALGEEQATIKECAAVLHVSEAELNGFFKRRPEAQHNYENGLATGIVSLRRQQFELATGAHGPGVARMLIWLGKQRLGQREPLRPKLKPKRPADLVLRNSRWRRP